MRELYGVSILFFYFLKWPIFILLPILYFNGLNNNWIIDIIWILCFILIIKDSFYILKKHKN